LRALYRFNFHCLKNLLTLDSFNSFFARRTVILELEVKPEIERDFFGQDDNQLF